MLLEYGSVPGSLFCCIDNSLTTGFMRVWQHRFNHAVHRYNEIYRVRMPNITPHVCRHTYCSNMARSGMNPKTLQYLMGHSDIGVTMDTYTHLGLDDAQNEMVRLQLVESARAEQDQLEGKTKESEKIIKLG